MRTEVNKTENTDTIESNKIKSSFFERTTKIDRSLITIIVCGPWINTTVLNRFYGVWSTGTFG